MQINLSKSSSHIFLAAPVKLGEYGKSKKKLTKQGGEGKKHPNRRRIA